MDFDVHSPKVLKVFWRKKNACALKESRNLSKINQAFCVYYTQARLVSHLFMINSSFVPRSFTTCTPTTPPQHLAFPVYFQMCSSMRNSVRSFRGLPVVSLSLLPARISRLFRQCLLFRYNLRFLVHILSYVISLRFLTPLSIHSGVRYVISSPMD